MQEDYQFTDFADQEDLVQKMKQLESAIQDRLGEEVVLIAYTHRAEPDGGQEQCRAGLDD